MALFGFQPFKCKIDHSKWSRQWTRGKTADPGKFGSSAAVLVSCPGDPPDQLWTRRQPSQLQISTTWAAGCNGGDMDLSAFMPLCPLSLVSLKQTYYGSCMQAPMKGCKWLGSAVNPSSAAGPATIIASPAGSRQTGETFGIQGPSFVSVRSLFGQQLISSNQPRMIHIVANLEKVLGCRLFCIICKLADWMKGVNKKFPSVAKKWENLAKLLVPQMPNPIILWYIGLGCNPIFTCYKSILTWGHKSVFTRGRKSNFPAAGPGLTRSRPEGQEV